MALLIGACRLATTGLATEPTADDDAGTPIEDGAIVADGAIEEVLGDGAIRNDTSPVFPTDDSEPIPECTGKADGTACVKPPGGVCVAGECLPSRCGDGILDLAREDCDDSNTDDGDTCPADCKAKCKTAADCNDKNDCSIDACDTTRHVCKAPTPVGDRRACTLAGGGVGVCNITSCTAASCGNGMQEGVEECDDGNADNTDGCRTNCTYTCKTDLECDDGNACTGVETCDTVNHRCRAGMKKTCADMGAIGACTVDKCIAPSGACSNIAVDNDGDTFYPTSLGSCGKDCHDGNFRVKPTQTAFSATPYIKFGSTTDTSFDFNCDGREEPLLAGTGRCTKSGPDCTHTPGWSGAEPKCGDPGQVVDACDPSGCKELLVARTQACR